MRTQGCEYAATPAPTADWIDWPAFSRAGPQPIHQCDKDSRYKPNLRTGDRADRPENSRHRLVAHVPGHPAVARILPKRCWLSGGVPKPAQARDPRSEEHTSELQSLMRISYAVFFLKKKKNK